MYIQIFVSLQKLEADGNVNKLRNGYLNKFIRGSHGNRKSFQHSYSKKLSFVINKMLKTGERLCNGSMYVSLK